MKKAIIASAVAISVIGGYIASPYAATKSLAKAIEEGDRKELKQRVDFPAIRASLKEQLSAAMANKMAEEMNKGDNADNPFAALGMAFAGKLVEGVIDTYITPSGLASMIQNGKAPDAKLKQDSTHQEKPSGEVNWGAAKSMQFSGLTEFTIELQEEGKEAPVYMVMTLDGLSWRLTDIDMTEALAEPKIK